MTTSEDRIDLVKRTVQAFRDVNASLSAGEAAEAAAKQLGLSAATVRRYLREQRTRQAHGVVNIEKYYTVYADVLPEGEEVHVLAIGDMHDDPRLDKQRFGWIGQLACERAPDAIIQIGDIATFDSLCRYDDNSSYRGKSKPLFMDDIASLREALETFDEGLGDFVPKIKHITLGNHEDRIESFSDRHPEIYGMMSGEFLDLLNKYNWTYSPFGKIIFIAGVGFTHVPLNEMGKPYGGKTAETQIANDITHDIVLGHSHRNRVHTGAKIGDGKFVRVVNLGSALPSGHIEGYAKHSATGWSYGVYWLTIKDRHIASWEFISMDDLEAMYG